MATGTGTKEDPWQLTTPPGTSGYQMWRDDAADPPVIVCQVGGTQLKYDARAIEDLHAWLKAQGDWVPLGGADEQKPAPDGSVEAWGRPEPNPVGGAAERSPPPGGAGEGGGRPETSPVGGWYGLKKGLRGRFGVYMPPLLVALGLDRKSTRLNFSQTDISRRPASACIN